MMDNRSSFGRSVRIVIAFGMRNVRIGNVSDCGMRTQDVVLYFKDRSNKLLLAGSRIR